MYTESPKITPTFVKMQKVAHIISALMHALCLGNCSTGDLKCTPIFTNHLSGVGESLEKS